MQQNPPLEIAETLRLLWELGEAMERDSRHLTDAAARLTHAARRAAEAKVAGRPVNPAELLAQTGATTVLASQIAADDLGIRDTAAELRVVLLDDAPSELSARALESLRRRLAARRQRPR